MSARKHTKAAELIIECFVRGHKVLVCGNGGSATQADHLAAEFIGMGKAAISLTNPAVMSALANDGSYSQVFSSQIDALGRSGDVLVVITTSGKSANILQARTAALRREMKVVALIGGERNSVLEFCDVVYWTKGDTPRVQEEHLCILHRIWEDVCIY